jgi:hypothetical protein
MRNSLDVHWKLLSLLRPVEYFARTKSTSFSVVGVAAIEVHVQEQEGSVSIQERSDGYLEADGCHFPTLR